MCFRRLDADSLGRRRASPRPPSTDNQSLAVAVDASSARALAKRPRAVRAQGGQTRARVLACSVACLLCPRSASLGSLGQLDRAPRVPRFNRAVARHCCWAPPVASAGPSGGATEPSATMSGLSLAVVKRLDAASLGRLYGEAGGGAAAAGNEWTCRAVFGMLPPLEQQIVLRLACCGAEGADVTLARRWVAGADGGGAFANAVKALEDLRVLELDKETRHLRLAAAFATNLRRALAGATAEPWRAGPAMGPDKRRPTEDQVAQWMVWRWNNVLLWLIGDDLDETAVPPECARAFLVGAGLMTEVAKDAFEISGSGVDFLLKPRAEQVWTLVDEYLKSHAPKEDRGDVVALVLTLAFATPCESYAVAELSGPQTRALEVLHALGLAYRRNEKSSRFYPTPLGVAVAFGGRGDEPGAADVSVLVQTNFQVLAYTDASVATSKLVLATLHLFAELQIRLPNLVVGTITRDAVKRCVARGIRVPQLVSFLEAHAHPLARASGRPLPPNVVDQMVLWAGEDKRVSFRPGVLVSFASDRAFDAATAAAHKQRCGLHWKSRARRALFVDADDEALVRKAAADAPAKKRARDAVLM
mmetsp:Transcript_858/g.2610  ORF Transcript_858/g.2610 Transcript_858/m.2610 type:complete len:589 (+) Transcript_858:405-2171(+)